MASYAPATHLETHEVTNQPAPLAPRNLYTTDTALREAVRREAGDWLDARLDRLGAVVAIRWLAQNFRLSSDTFIVHFIQPSTGAAQNFPHQRLRLTGSFDRPL